jgi:hypothetical protein
MFKLAEDYDKLADRAVQRQAKPPPPRQVAPPGERPEPVAD